ncbi:Glutathione S-transferase kappa 1 [Modicella reniformis]|uniref:Glutathione S-transferase kappa n=1 Tax=Modicella reniformis TaxID=1440133 RepID=A0A9P6J763_9FUNG|nr:Glutathione S-transferase kappa 1 [Modicella reniformis]
MASRASILCYYDIVSPYSYIGVKLLNRYRLQWKDVDVVYRPVFLGGIMAGAKNQPPAMVPAKGTYMMGDLKKISAATGIPFRFPSQFPLLTILTMRLLVVIQKQEPAKYEQCIDKDEYWCNDKNIAENEVIVNALAPIVGSVDKMKKYLEMTSQKEIKQGLIDNTDQALAAGAFGAPTWVVKQAGSDKEHMFFGSDRFELMATLLNQPYPGLTFGRPSAKL